MHWIAIGILIGIGLLLAPFVVSAAGWTLYGVVWFFLVNPILTPFHIAHDWKLPPEQKKYSFETNAMGLVLLVLYGSWLFIPLIADLTANIEKTTPTAASVDRSLASVDRLVDDIVSKGHAKGLSGNVEAGLSAAIPANTLEAVRNAIRPCWNSFQLPSNAPVVTLVVQMSEDGTPIKAEVADGGRYNSEPLYRLGADAAWRAVMNPRCQPLPLPRESYTTWRTITFRFDPRDF